MSSSVRAQKDTLKLPGHYSLKWQSYICCVGVPGVFWILHHMLVLASRHDHRCQLLRDCRASCIEGKGLNEEVTEPA